MLLQILESGSEVGETERRIVIDLGCCPGQAVPSLPGQLQMPGGGLYGLCYLGKNLPNQVGAAASVLSTRLVKSHLTYLMMCFQFEFL